jgi:3',5'-cyclic AMP phosphodiesterase CpdA
MAVLAHISDLHFGTEDPAIAEELRQELHRLAPTLLVISGDLTQRARLRQFASATEYLQQLPQPQLLVPGNHDIPLFDLIRRFLAPLGRYRRWIHHESDPCFHHPDVSVLGLNTARSLTWKSGRISFEQMKLVQSTFASTPPQALRVVVTHHPFLPPPEKAQGSVKLVGRAPEALQILTTSRIDLLLAGHLHHGFTGDVRTQQPTTRHSIVVAQAGTAISRRLRQQTNAYNVISLQRDRMTIVIRAWSRNRFEDTLCTTYSRRDGQWQAVRG